MSQDFVRRLVKLKEAEDNAVHEEDNTYHVKRAGKWLEVIWCLGSQSYKYKYGKKFVDRAEAKRICEMT